MPPPESKEASDQPDASFSERWGNRLGVGVMRLLARLPLSWVRGLGWIMGQVLHAVASRRRRIARTNWALCFPQDGTLERHRAVRRHFVAFAQAWLDRSWLWEGSEATVRSRLKVVGATHELHGDQPVLMLAPHFVGMDAGGTALALLEPRPYACIYLSQINADVDQWIRTGRLRFGTVRLIEKQQGLRTVVQSIRSGEALYLLPDMDLGPEESIFVPFFGVPTATVPTLPRLARLGGAKVVPVVTRLTRRGYEVEVMPAWPGYPGPDAVEDTAQMNRRIEGMIKRIPEQYYWVHKRFKTRPPGEPSLYGSD